MWRYGINWKQNCPMWDLNVFSLSIIWAYARVQMKHALSISSDPRAAAGTNTTHTHTHFAIYAWMFFYAWYVIYVKCRWELKDCSVWDCQWFIIPNPLFPHSRSELVVCWCLFCWLCSLRMFACYWKCVKTPWMAMLQKKGKLIKGRKDIFSSWFLHFSYLYNLYNKY